MEDGGPPTPSVPPASPSITSNHVTCTSDTATVPPAQPLPTQPIQPAHVPQLNWSHFRTNDWMDTHAFQEGPTFLSNMSKRSKIWYESLRPINIDWVGLQNQFRQQYSKIANTREQLFLAWRYFILMKTQKH